MQTQLFDLLGFDNIEQIGNIIQNRREFILEYDIQSQENMEKTIDMFIQVSCYPRIKAIEFLNKHQFNLNDAIDDFYDRQKGLQYITNEGVEIPREDIDLYYEKLEEMNQNQEYDIQDVKIIDQMRLNNIAYKTYELDLHGCGYQEALDLVMLKINEIVFKMQDANRQGQKIHCNLKIITGRGIHSETNPVIKYGVQDLLKQNNISYKVLEESKGGAIMVRIKHNQQTL